MTVGGLVDTVFRFNRLCECHLYTAPRNKIGHSKTASNDADDGRIED
jgi:hypothetical protein